MTVTWADATLAIEVLFVMVVLFIGLIRIRLEMLGKVQDLRGEIEHNRSEIEEAK